MGKIITEIQVDLLKVTLSCEMMLFCFKLLFHSLCYLPFAPLIPFPIQF